MRAHGTLGVGAVLSTHRTLRGSDFRHFALNSLMRRNLRPREEHNPPPRKPALRQMPGQKAENLSHFPFHRATFPVSFLTSETPTTRRGRFLTSSALNSFFNPCYKGDVQLGQGGVCNPRFVPKCPGCHEAHDLPAQVFTSWGRWLSRCSCWNRSFRVKRLSSLVLPHVLRCPG